MLFAHVDNTSVLGRLTERVRCHSIMLHIYSAGNKSSRCTRQSMITLNKIDGNRSNRERVGFMDFLKALMQKWCKQSLKFEPFSVMIIFWMLKILSFVNISVLIFVWDFNKLMFFLSPLPMWLVDLVLVSLFHFMKY